MVDEIREEGIVDIGQHLDSALARRRREVRQNDLLAFEAIDVVEDVLDEILVVAVIFELELEPGEFAVRHRQQQAHHLLLDMRQRDACQYRKWAAKASLRRKFPEPSKLLLEGHGLVAWQVRVAIGRRVAGQSRCSVPSP
jgi:hypothetical protein